MKANRRRSASTPLFALLAPAAIAALAGCVPSPRTPAPPSSPRPAPPPAPRPAPPALPARPPTTAWQDAPATPGEWSVQPVPGGTIAVFAGGQFSLRCTIRERTITLFRALPDGGPARTAIPAAMTVMTTAFTRALPTEPAAGGVAADLPASDRLFDAMAFSRGRFAVAVPGAATLYIPSWTEVSRLVEDCR